MVCEAKKSLSTRPSFVLLFIIEAHETAHKMSLVNWGPNAGSRLSPKLSQKVTTNVFWRTKTTGQPEGRKISATENRAKGKEVTARDAMSKMRPLQPILSR